MLRREGWRVNRKRVHRLYKLEGLQVRIRRRQKVVSQLRVRPPVAREVNETWTMDFMSDRLENGRRFRVLSLVDQYSRECLWTEAGQRMTAHRVVEVLDRVKAGRTLPKRIVVDNGTEFDSRELDAWAYFNQVKIHFIRPGKPVENAYIESFNGRMRDEFLNANAFESMADAAKKLESFKLDYNRVRPHGSLGGLPPEEFVRAQNQRVPDRQKLNSEILQILG